MSQSSFPGHGDSRPTHSLPSYTVTGLKITHMDTLVPMSKLHPHSPKMSAFLTTGQAQECTGREWSTFT